jgi:chemotaxis protein methyltransferase CheR
MSTELLTEPGSTLRLSNREFELFRTLIYGETGINLKSLKQQMLSARLSRRVRALELGSFTEYYELVTNSDPERAELREMINAVTTNLTAFFREPAHFAFLKSWLTDRGMRQRRFRLWCAASSTGQEPYCLSMTFHEAFGDQLPAYDVRILATDIDTQVLDTARAGIYRVGEIENLTAERQRSYFLQGKRSQDGLARVKPAITQLVCFRQLNLIAPEWPVRGPFDAIFCRNVLIYFDEPTQRSVIQRLRSLIRPGGLLFVGHSESLHWAQKILKTVGHAVYEVPHGV